MTIRNAAAAAAVLVAFGSIGQSAKADPAPFYKGKTVTLLIGADAGGGYDLYARAIARFLPDHIPGAPTIVPQNMPGAGSANAASALFTTYPHDGTAIGALFPGAVIEPLLTTKKYHYDPAKFQYLASADSSSRVCVTWGPSKVKTYKDALTTPASMGASAPGASTYDYVQMHDHATGSKFKVVTGYKGTVDILLAMERSEVDGLCGIDWSSLQSQRPQWLTGHKINILVQDAIKPNPELTALGVPSMSSFLKPGDKDAVDLIVGQQVFARPYVAAPGTPPQAVDILRAGFAATLADPRFLAQAKTQRLAVSPITGQEIQDLVQKLYASSPQTIALAKQLIAP